MHRIDTPTAQADKFGPGKNGFTNGDPATGRRATDLNSDMWDAVQEEICNVVEKSGLALNKDQHDQLHQAIVKIITSKIPDALLKKNNLSDLADKALARANLQLKTAAQKDAVTSQTDTTAGRVLIVGYGGLGGTAPRTAVAGSNSYDNIPIGLPSGFWTHAIDGGPYAHTVTLLQDGGGNRDDRHLIIPSSYTDKIAIRWDSGTTKNYQYFYTDKNKPTAADVGAVPSGRKVNGHALDKDTNVTSQDIFNGQAIGLSTEDLDTLKTPGIYYQPANANTSAARHYPETNAGTLLVYKNAGVTQVYIVYNSSRTYTRSQYSTGAWTAWAKQYDTANKPTAADVGALASNGNAVSATKLQTPRTIGGVAFDGTANINLPGVNTSGNQSTTGNAASATRLQTARTIAGVSFNGTANIAIPAGNVGAYTKAECDARFGVVNGFRRGGQQIYNSGQDWIGNWEVPAGCVMTGLKADGAPDGRRMGIYYRQLQFLNKQTGAWVNIGG